VEKILFSEVEEILFSEVEEIPFSEVEEILFSEVDWNQLIQNRTQWRNIVQTEMNYYYYFFLFTATV
jgi:hypothetical protein